MRCRANLERETINPTSGLMYDTSGLGANGAVLPSTTTTTTTTTPPLPTPAPTPAAAPL